MIDVEKRALRAFEQNSFSALERAMQINDRIRDKRPQLFPRREITLMDFAIIDRFRAECLENAVVLTNLGLQFFCEQDRLHQIGNPETASRRFIAVGWTDAAFGRSNFCPAFS